MTTALRLIAPWRMIAGILLIAATLRASFTGLAPLLDQVSSQFSLSATQTGVLTTLPLFAFAFISPLAARVSRYFGPERSLVTALLIICTGILLRSSGNLSGLYLGTVLIGTGIAVGNVLLPGLIKRDFPGHIPRLTGAYSLTMGVAAGLGSAAMVPLAIHFGWQGALVCLMIFPILALAMWWDQVGKGNQGSTAQQPTYSTPRIWSNSLAWFITFFLGINSLIYYVVIGWLPMILMDAGYSEVQAGSLHGLMQLACAVPGLFIGMVISRMRDQRTIAAGVSLLCSFSLAGLWFFPSAASIWVCLFGFGSGATMILGLSFIGLKTSTAHEAASLSGMAQSVGYLLAAFGPPLAGNAHAFTHSWAWPVLGCAVLSVVMAIFGAVAGKAHQ
ncbi:MFS transporter [Mangrovibacter yixingensis]|uniref:MFS transporter n=1 Tax=Mangrovibacter yixingensis TaxID=1529639 RepID=UPI001CF9E8BD|nr:MFS transporter [Mangrovibacter yixingensis]